MSGIEVVRNARARRTRLSVDPASGRVRLILPRRAPVGPALRWAEQHGAWIATQQAKLPTPRPFEPGAILPIAGEDVRLEWAEGAIRTVRRSGDALVCGGPIEGFAPRIARWLKAEAARVLAADTAHFAGKAGVSVEGVGVGDPRSRWGSCSSSGAIRYSWRLLLAPPFVRRSTVAHEVAHRVHMDHSPAFHALAAALDEGNPAEARHWLRTHGASLHWFGRTS